MKGRGPKAAGAFLPHHEHPVSGYKNEQRHLQHRGRDFHFVSYEERDANTRLGESALPPMWFLMTAGKRWAVMDYVPGQDAAETDRALLSWLDENVFGSKASRARSLA